MSTTLALMGCLSCSGLTAQIGWFPVPQPPSPIGGLVYDSWRHRLVNFRNGPIEEFDGSNWVQSGSGSWYWGFWMVFDEARSESLLCVQPSATSQAVLLAWNGQVMWPRGSPPIVLLYALPSLTTAHSTYGLVFAVSVPGVNGIALYSWNGQFFNLLSAANPPPTLLPNGSYEYHSLTCDRQTGRLVLFGREESNAMGPVANVQITWEWDPTTGWTNHGGAGSFPPLRRSSVWHDAHRGAIFRLDQIIPPQPAMRWMGGNVWVPVTTQNSGGSFYYVAGYDGARNRTYAHSSSGGGLGYIGDVYPAAYDGHPGGCGHMLSPQMRLTNPSTRAWIGTTHSVDIDCFSAAFGGIAMGFDGQFWGSNPLPMSLASLGMPNCLLGIDPQVVLSTPLVGGTATINIPIPNQTALLGVQFFEQPFSLVPSANPLGLLVGNSMRATVGSAY